MKHRWFAICALLSFVSLAAVSISAAQERTAGSLEFIAEAAPTDGRAEPVRQFPFYLLSNSMAAIRIEASQSEPMPDEDRFIDGLYLSAELKSWMKKHHTVDLAGEDFTKQLTADDIIGIPEFLAAYKDLNGASLSVAVSGVKMKEADRAKNPEKYDRELKQYTQALHHYIETNPDTIAGLDAVLRDKDPGQRWAKIVADQRRELEHRTLQLAQTRYLVARTDSDLDGRGHFSDIAPGKYWLTALDTPALVGDARLRWDFPVTIRAGETARAELSNVNARDLSQ